MFKLNPFEVITILAPVIILLWRFYVVVFAEEKVKQLDKKIAKQIQKDFKKIEKELREYGTSDWKDDHDLIVDVPRDHIRLNKTICLSCRRANDHVPPVTAVFYKKERTAQQEVHIFTLDKNVTCEHCGFMYSTVEGVIREAKKEQKPMGKKVLLRGYSCEYCNHHVNSDTPVHAEMSIDGATGYLTKGSFECPECQGKSSSIKNPVLWEQPIKKPTVQEIMDEHNEQIKRRSLLFKFFVFIVIWGSAAMGIYALSFVPWLQVFSFFWEVFKYVTYYLTRWYTLVGLFVTLFIFYQWHKQAIKDKIAYLSNIYGTRRRYRKLVSRKESVTEDELKSFVNEVNHKDRLKEETQDKLIQSIQPDLDVTEDSIPF